jgi:hypothetical protein
MAQPRFKPHSRLFPENIASAITEIAARILLG